MVFLMDRMKSEIYVECIKESQRRKFPICAVRFQFTTK